MKRESEGWKRRTGENRGEGEPGFSDPQSSRAAGCSGSQPQGGSLMLLPAVSAPHRAAVLRTEGPFPVLHLHCCQLSGRQYRCLCVNIWGLLIRAQPIYWYALFAYTGPIVYILVSVFMFSDMRQYQKCFLTRQNAWTSDLRGSVINN